MRKARIALGLAGLVALSLAALGQADAWSPNGLGAAAPHAPIATPAKVFRDCQEIALCTGCKPVYKCRSCEYQRVCTRGFCEWRDVCVWGPYVKVLPPGARIIKIR